MQRLCGLMRKAVQDYEMIAPGDKVMVGVSGGKDSVALTIGLAELRKYIGFDFTVQAVTLDPQFGGRPMDYTVLQEDKLCIGWWLFDAECSQYLSFQHRDWRIYPTLQRTLEK
jgi:tRNA(Ile)-lysidine synthase TilS/MesJ